MATFRDADEVYDVLGTFLDEITKAPDLQQKFMASKTSFMVNQTGPDCQILIDCTTNPPRVVTAPAGETAEIEMFMSADDGHKFWLGELNAPIAMAKRQIKVKGPLSKLMKLLPAVQPAFPRYRTFLEEHGHADKLT